MLAENVICKLFAMALIVVVLWTRREKISCLGFVKKGIARSAALGLSLGVSTFAISYGVEYVVLTLMGSQPKIQFYISNFALSNQNVTGTSPAVIVICILGNVLNVLAEEGLFRGLFLHLGKEEFSVKKSNAIQAALFGVWHIVMVVVWVMEGSMDVPSAVLMAAGYVLLAGILGYEWGLCVALTGTIWAGVFEHFFNNFITKSLHMATASGVDEMQILRIVLSNVLSLTFVILIARKRKNAGEAI